MKKIFLSMVIMFWAFILPVTVMAKEKTAFTKTDAILYMDNDYTGENYGMILKGSELTVDTDNIDGAFIKVTYAGITGYIQTNTVTYDIRELMGDNESYVTTKMQALFPLRNFTECNKDANAALMNYIAYNPNIEAFINVENSSKFFISGNVLTMAHNYGAEYVLVHVGDGSDIVTFKLMTFNVANDDTFDLSFTCENKMIDFDSPKSVESLLLNTDIYITTTMGELKQENSGTLKAVDGFYKLKNANRIIPADEDTVPYVDVSIGETSGAKGELQEPDVTEEIEVGSSGNEKGWVLQLSALVIIAVICIVVVVIKAYKEKRRKEKWEKTISDGIGDKEL